MAEERRTMRQVAEYTGLSPSTIHNIIVGKYLPSSATAVKLAEYFRVDPDVALELAGHRPPRPDELPSFHAYVSLKFKNKPALQRSLIKVYEAFREYEAELERHGGKNSGEETEP
jgi:DNA-binding XRE family transcriptional regulator